MARSIRLEFEGAYYHVMARGNRRGEIFLDDQDREHFLRVLGEACARTGWRVHARVLMSNHYHLLVETPEANLVSGMQWLQNTYTCENIGVRRLLLTSLQRGLEQAWVAQSKINA